MRIEFVYARDAAYFSEAGLRVVVKPLMAAGYAFAAALLVGGVGSALWLNSVFAGLGVALAGAVCGFGVYELGLWQAARQDATSQAVMPRRWVLTDETMESASDLTEARFAWTVFQSVSAWPRSYHLAADWGTVIDIPREPLTIEDDAALRAVFARHGLRIG